MKCSRHTIHSLSVCVNALVTSSDVIRRASSQVSGRTPHSPSNSRTVLRASPADAGTAGSPNTPALWGS